MVQVKICGITRLEDAIAAVEAGADLLGFIFYDKSPRYINPDDVASLVSQLSDLPLQATLVGVFVDEPPDRVRAILDECGLDLAQLHGSEPPVEVAALAPRAFKAIRAKNRTEIEAQVAAFTDVVPDRADVPSFLLDAYHPWKLGGTGRTAPWPAARAIARRHRILLAGGLTPDNVAEAVRTVEPWGVDVSSGVELRPGVKDHDKVRRFIEAAKAVGIRDRPNEFGTGLETGQTSLARD